MSGWCHPLAFVPRRYLMAKGSNLWVAAGLFYSSQLSRAPTVCVTRRVHREENAIGIVRSNEGDANPRKSSGIDVTVDILAIKSASQVWVSRNTRGSVFRLDRASGRAFFRSIDPHKAIFARNLSHGRRARKGKPVCKSRGWKIDIDLFEFVFGYSRMNESLLPFITAASAAHCVQSVLPLATKELFGRFGAAPLGRYYICRVKKILLEN